MEDLVSAVFEKVITKYRAYDDRRASMEAWIISIAKNVVNDYFRPLLSGYKSNSVNCLEDELSGDV